MRQPFLLADSVWVEIKDGDDTARDIFHQHYSYSPKKDGKDPLCFVGPGQRMVLMTPDAKGLFIWRKQDFTLDGQKGVNCSVFRNESAGLASELILEAEKLAWKRWPGERLFTYVNASKVKSINPGFCFLKAGWKKCGQTKVNKLIILEKYQ